LFSSTARYWQRAPIGGFLAGVALWCLPPSHRVAISLFFAVRAFEVMVYHGAQKKILPVLPHADSMLMMVSSAQIIWGLLFRPRSLDPGYYRFLLHHGGMPAHNLTFFSNLVRPLFNPSIFPAESIDTHMLKLKQTEFGPDVPMSLTKWGKVSTEVLERCAATRHACKELPLDMDADRLFCMLFHPGDSCTYHFFDFFKAAFMRSLPVYIPVYTLPVVLFGLMKFIRDPVPKAITIVSSIVRSSTFLGLYCTLGHTAMCAVNNVYGSKYSKLSGVLAGLACGSAVLLEKKSRRIELALYVFSHAAQTFWRDWVSLGVFTNIPHGEVLLFAASFAVITWAYINEPYFLRPSYFSLLRCVFFFKYLF
jgi:hypothetical protein